MRLNQFRRFIGDVIVEWQKDKIPLLAAGLSYFMAFSIAPLLIIVIGVGGLILGRDTARQRVIVELEQVAGAEGAELVEEAVVNAADRRNGTVPTAIGVVTVLIGATGVFFQLRQALNTVWHVQRESFAGFVKMLRSRALGFAMVLVFGILLILSLVLDTALSIVRRVATNFLPGGEKLLVGGLNFAITVVIIAVIFAAIYKLLPDTRIAWSDVWIGALIAAFLFTIIETLLGQVLGIVGSTSPFSGAAGSLIVIMLWVYLSAQVLLFGAEVTHVYTYQFGSRAMSGVRTQGQAEAAEPPINEQTDL